MKNDSFSMDVIRRILEVLSNEGNTKRTALAGKTGLNYTALVRYLGFLETLKWVDFLPDSGGLISITSVGRSFRKLLEHKGVPDDISEQALEKLLMQCEGQDIRKISAENVCVFCGNTIRKYAIAREIGGKLYSFDKKECATIFMKLRDVYGRQSLL